MLSAVYQYVWGPQSGSKIDTDNGTAYSQGSGYLYSSEYVETRNIDDEDGLITVIKAGNKEGLKALLADFADPSVRDELGRTPLHIAAKSDRLDFVKLLMEGPMKPDIDAKDSHGFTALHLACGLGMKAMVQCLLDYGANPEATDEEGKTPIHIACCRTSDASKLHDRIDALELLIRKKPDLDYRDNSGQAPLHVAAMENNYLAVQKLLAGGACRSLPDKHDVRPYDIAQKRGFTGIMNMLSREDKVAQMGKLKQYAEYLA